MNFTRDKRIKVPSSTINAFYADREIDLEFEPKWPNQFINLVDEKDSSQSVMGMYNQNSDKVEIFEPTKENVWGIYPRNEQQACALNALLDDDIKLVTISGGAGTGKTLMAIAAGLAKTTDEDVYQKLLVARPIFPMGKDIGFLPGDLDEKVKSMDAAYLR